MYNPNPRAETLLQETRSLVSLPEICLKLRDVLEDPEHTRKQVLDVIINDPALTARLLRIVNSAHFGLSTPVRDVSHALAILGEHDLQNLVMVTSIVQSMQSSLSLSLDITEFWKASVFSAMLARNLGEMMNAPAKEELFIAGLLLNIGKLPLYFREPELYREVMALAREKQSEPHVVERELLGFDHCDVGAVLAKNWNFSEVLVEAIAGHHAAGSTEMITGRIARVTGIVGEVLDMTAVREFSPRDERLQPLLEGVQEARFSEVIENSCLGYEQVFEAFIGKHNG